MVDQKKIEKIINQLYANLEIDLVEAPDWSGITSFIQPRKSPIVVKLNGSDTYFCHLDHRPVKWNNKFHERRVLEKADGLLSVSQFTAELSNEVFGLHKKFTIIPNAIDTSHFIDNSCFPLLRKGFGGEDSLVSFEHGYKNAFPELVYQIAVFFWCLNDFDNLNQCVSWRVNPNLNTGSKPK